MGLGLRAKDRVGRLSSIERRTNILLVRKQLERAENPNTLESSLQSLLKEGFD